jgi:hypothetical protein
MTQLLKKAMKKVSSLPESEQDEIARLILDEIEDEKHWQKQFESTQDELLILADEALREEKSGRTKQMKMNM